MANDGRQAVAHIVSKLGLQNAVAESIRSKSQEYLRKYHIKMSSQDAVLGTMNVAKPAVAVNLACTSGDVHLNTAVDFKVLQRMSGVTPAQYEKVRSIMMQVVGIKQEVSPRHVCITFGCLRLEKIVRDTLEEYDARRVARRNVASAASAANLNSSRRTGTTGLDTDLAGRDGMWPPRLVGAAFTLVAEAYDTRFDKKFLLKWLGIRQREYKAALEAMAEEMHDVFFEESNDGEENGEENGEGVGGKD